MKADTENREDPKFAASVMEELCPSPTDRLLVLQQFLASIEVAQKISPDIWAVTLFHDGFRLNVGPVEVMTYNPIALDWPFPQSSHNRSPTSTHSPALFQIRLLLHGDVSDDVRRLIREDKDTHEIVSSNYKSVPVPQWCYLGSGELVDGALSVDSHRKIEMALRLVAPMHAEFIRYAAHTPTGTVRKTSNFRRSHSSGLYLYAQSFLREGQIASSVLDGTATDSKESWLAQEELPADEPLVEGASVTVKVSAFERNPLARKKCVEHYGSTCTICGFSFGAAYGSTAAGYVHVHHLKPLASIGKEYVIDPIKDLRPVCANCHAVIHMRQPPYSIEEVKGMLGGIADA